MGNVTLNAAHEKVMLYNISVLKDALQREFDR